MSKPRLAEILGVEINRDFCVDGYNGFKFKIDESGDISVTPSATYEYALNALFALACAINYPEYVIQEPKWTKQDVEDAKAIKRLIPWAHIIGRDHFGTMYVVNNSKDTLIGASFFQNLKNDEEIKLDDIINSEVADNE